MKTIGQIIKEARIKKKYSLSKVEKETKIKREFIDSIEKETWENLPEFPVVLGFVKNIASFLEVSERQAIATLKRDYPPKVLNMNPKPDVASKFVWSPKLTFITGVLAIVAVIMAYLVFQYVKFISPPELSVSEPKQDQIIKDREVVVFGKTDSDAVVKANNQPFLVNSNGEFKGKIQVYEGTSEVTIKAISRSGRETVVSIRIKPELNK